jgi:hypothetical protein
MWHAWAGETCIGFWWERPRERYYLEDQGIYGRMDSKWTLRGLAGWDVEWIHLVQGRDRWRDLVNAV